MKTYIALPVLVVLMQVADPHADSELPRRQAEYCKRLLDSDLSAAEYADSIDAALGRPYEPSVREYRARGYYVECMSRSPEEFVRPQPFVFRERPKGWRE